jgi:transcription antitermination protein NusB
MGAKRRIVREKVLQTLYAFELSREPLDFVISQILSELKEDRETFAFAETLVRKTVTFQDEIDEMIRKRVANWEFNRIAVMDRLILRMCICELLHFEDIPPKVSINEAIEIARRYSTDKSDKFVNGVLDSILDDLKSTGGLKKTGRGLVEQSIRKGKKE